MKREDQTYEKWLDKLKNTEPVLNAPEELTNDILNKIKTLPSRTSLLKEAKGKSKTNRILLSVSKISGIAAALLLFSDKRNHFLFTRQAVSGAILCE